MHVFISHPAAVPALRDFLERAECVVGACNPYDLEVHLAHAPSEAHARRELDVYLATWQAMNPGVEAYVADADDAPVG
jgi:hypothetical protein